MRKEEIHFFQQDKVYLSRRQGIRSLRSWCCSNPTPFSLSFPIPFFSPQSSHQAPGPQTSNGPRAPAEPTTKGVIFSCRVNPHRQRTAQNKTQPKSYFPCLNAFAGSSTWQQQTHPMQEALCNTKQL